ncbi:HAD-IA family hydrolase [Acinetobacter sp. WU_MDCI_Abxe161]|uniref:HAD family hydrolase n=1 Tax=Acinetobacter sp. WU_MDCI_Abxe161 TaxID=2850074 RepID=UPI0021CD7686|nr:HAD-IA family hydrolase [Acinetobacter sp. WU_MDCI_Abxe161]MCU4503496.1 HAD-IA family hydrolase [Acinetobacter sp. WU_MDCI_Abxe161]
MIEKNELMKKKLVIFDLDGTLVDTLDDVVTSLNEALAIYNYQGVTKDYVKGYLGYGGNTLVSSILKFDEKHLVNEINNIYLEKYQKNLLNNTILYPGVMNTLDCLANLDVKMAVCTNKKSNFTWEIIEELKIKKYFKIIVSGDTLEDKKPSGIPLSHIINKLSIEKTNTVMVGDTEIDYKSAISADVEFIYANYGYGETIKTLNKVNNFKELLNYFK